MRTVPDPLPDGLYPGPDGTYLCLGSAVPSNWQWRYHENSGGWNDGPAGNSDTWYRVRPPRLPDPDADRRLPDGSIITLASAMRGRVDLDDWEYQLPDGNWLGFGGGGPRAPGFPLRVRRRQ